MSKYLEKEGLQYFWNKLKARFVVIEDLFNDVFDVLNDQSTEITSLGNRTSTNTSSINTINTNISTINGNITTLNSSKISEPQTDGQNGYALLTDGHGGRGWGRIASAGTMTISVADETLNITT